MVRQDGGRLGWRRWWRRGGGVLGGGGDGGSKAMALPAGCDRAMMWWGRGARGGTRDLAEGERRIEENGPRV